jgi:uncharacterized protein (TIGR02145 family)
MQSFFYHNDSTQLAVNGRLYTWYTAMDGEAGDTVQGICPDGWHLPSDNEWMEWWDRLGGAEDAGMAMLAGGSSGFDAVLSGGADANGNFVYAGEWAMYWGSTEASDERAYHYGVDADGTLDRFAASKGALIHVRCVKDG